MTTRVKLHTLQAEYRAVSDELLAATEKLTQYQQERNDAIERLVQLSQEIRLVTLQMSRAQLLP